MPQKTQPLNLVRTVADEFNTYIGKGVKIGPLSEKVDPNLNIDDLDKVLRIHFLLTGLDERDYVEEGVASFVEALPERIRRLETAIERQTSVVQGGIRGQVDWQETIKQHSQRGYWDQTQFVCRESAKELDTKENVILKRLLGKILSILENDLQVVLENPNDYPWLSTWLKNPGLYDILDRTYRQNIYIDQISEDVEITDRMIRSVQSARQPLYREAAEFLSRYRRLMRYDLYAEEAKDVLQHSFIVPDQHDYATLFELYWIFRIVRQYPDAQFQVIDESSDLIARWTYDEFEYLMYNNVTERVGLKFRIDRGRAEVDADLSAIRDARPRKGYFEREAIVVDQGTKIGKQAFGSTPSGTFWSGRPDIILIKRRSDTRELEKVLLGESKYTQDERYMAEGIEQLLQYVYYAQDANDSYLVDEPPDIPDWVYPVLFVDRLPEDIERESLPVRICETEDEIDFKI